MWVKVSVGDQILIGDMSDKLVEALTTLSDQVLPPMLKLTKAGMVKFRREPGDQVGHPVIIPLDEPRTAGDTYVRLDTLMTMTPMQEDNVTVQQLIGHYSPLIQPGRPSFTARTFPGPN